MGPPPTSKTPHTHTGTRKQETQDHFHLWNVPDCQEAAGYRAEFQQEAAAAGAGPKHTVGLASGTRTSAPVHTEPDYPLDKITTTHTQDYFLPRDTGEREVFFLLHRLYKTKQKNICSPGKRSVNHKINLKESGPQIIPFQIMKKLKKGKKKACVGMRVVLAWKVAEKA